MVLDGDVLSSSKGRGPAFQLFKHLVFDANCGGRFRYAAVDHIPFFVRDALDLICDFRDTLLSLAGHEDVVQRVSVCHIIEVRLDLFDVLTEHFQGVVGDDPLVQQFERVASFFCLIAENAHCIRNKVDGGYGDTDRTEHGANTASDICQTNSKAVCGCTSGDGAGSE